MKIINKTGYPTKWLKEITLFCMPDKVRVGTITFHWRKHHGSVSGRFRHERVNGKIAVTLPKKREYDYPYEWAPWNRIMKKGYLTHIRLDFEDEVVHVVAHELRHMEQFQRPRMMYFHGCAKNRLVERDADCYAIRLQRRWRKEHPYIQPSIKNLPFSTEIYSKYSIEA
jgi:hypothetical protein